MISSTRTVAFFRRTMTAAVATSKTVVMMGGIRKAFSKVTPAGSTYLAVASGFNDGTCNTVRRALTEGFIFLYSDLDALVAESCGLDRTMGGPRVLRHSRGAELLNLGIPVLIVQKYLGLQSPAQAVQLRDFQDSEAREILHSHLRRETLRHSSARNAFAGTISAISESTTMAEVVLSAPSGLEVRARISMESVRSLNLHEGQTVTATVKAPWVVLAPANTQTSNANNYQATVLYVREGPLEASVRLSLEDGTGMAALMGRDGVQRLGLAAGLQCTVSFSSMSVVLTPN